MNPLIILEIIKLSLEITLEVIKGIPPEQRQQMWEDHAKAIAFWQGLFTRLAKVDPTP